MTDYLQTQDSARAGQWFRGRRYEALSRLLITLGLVMVLVAPFDLAVDVAQWLVTGVWTVASVEETLLFFGLAVPHAPDGLVADLLDLPFSAMFLALGLIVALAGCNIARPKQ